MEPQLYLEFPTDLLAARAVEGFGRCYADTESTRISIGVNGEPPAGATQEIRDAWATTIYPVPPEDYNGSPYPLYANGAPPQETYTYIYAPSLPKAGIGAGGVLPLDDFMVSMLKSQTLSDGSTWTLDLETEPKTATQLSAAGQAAIVPPQPPGG